VAQTECWILLEGGCVVVGGRREGFHGQVSPFVCAGARGRWTRGP
jgi:hypothetical protein